MKNKFTLIELLVVVAIIAILLTMLLPSLKNARYEAMRAVCLSNMKQYSNGIMLHCNDNNRRYPNYSGVTNPGPYNDTYYSQHVFQRMNYQVKPIFKYMGFEDNQLFGNTVRDSVTCPFIAQALISKFENSGNYRHVDINGDGEKERYVRYPFGNTAFNSGFNHYFATYNKVIQKPMVFQGDSVQLKNAYLTSDLQGMEGSNILLSDLGEFHGNSTNGYITNHPPRSGQSLILDERKEEPSKIWSHNIKRGFVVTGHFSANYIFTDGSGKVKKRVNKSQLIGIKHFYQVPKEFYK